MSKLSNKYSQCIAVHGQRPRYGSVIKVFLTKHGMRGVDRDSGRRVQYIQGSTNVWQEQEVAHG